MKQFIRNIALFGLPFLGLLVWLWASMPPKDYTYNMILKDCRTGMWMHRRLYQSSAPIDVAFIGTSKTMCDVNDSLLQAKLLESYQLPLQIANFGVCRTGENLHYLIARDVLAAKHPKYLVMEVSSKLSTNSHFHFPHAATTKEVMAAPLWANSDYLHNVVEFTWNRLVYQRERTLGITRKFEDFLQDSLHSYMHVANDIVADSAEMMRVKAKRQKDITDHLPKGLGGWIYQAEANVPKYYFQKIAALCQENHCQLVFLYLPSYGDGATVPQEKAFFEAMGPIWIPPDSVFQNPRFHHDNSHLNMRGAASLNDWLAHKVAERMGK